MAVSLFLMIPFTCAKFVLVSRTLWDGHNPNTGTELLRCSDLTHPLSLPAFPNPLTQPVKERHPSAGGQRHGTLTTAHGVTVPRASARVPSWECLDLRDFPEWDILS